MTEVSRQQIQGLIERTAKLSLSSFDMARFLYSTLAHQQLTATVKEVSLHSAPRHHFVLQFGEFWLDCGADNAAQAQLALLHESQIAQQIQTLDVAVLPEAQLAFMCMETAHFDHCY